MGREEQGDPNKPPYTPLHVLRVVKVLFVRNALHVIGYKYLHLVGRCHGTYLFKLALDNFLSSSEFAFAVEHINSGFLTACL